VYRYASGLRTQRDDTPAQIGYIGWPHNKHSSSYFSHRVGYTKRSGFEFQQQHSVWVTVPCDEPSIANWQRNYVKTSICKIQTQCGQLDGPYHMLITSGQTNWVNWRPGWNGYVPAVWKFI